LDTIGSPSCPHRFFDRTAWLRRTRRGAGLVAMLLGACLNAGRQDVEPTAPARLPEAGAVHDVETAQQVPDGVSSAGSCGGE
jgi:hypothetical protein